MTEKIRDRLKYRPHKHFLRFKSPVYYLDTEGKWKQARDEFKTWVSVADTHKYMLHFPHNFNVLSLGTMGIITDDFWGPDGKWDISGYCNEPCAKLMKPRCSLSWRDIQEFVANVTVNDKQDWNYICFQLDYDVNDVIRNPNTRNTGYILLLAIFKGTVFEKTLSWKRDFKKRLCSLQLLRQGGPIA